MHANYNYLFVVCCCFTHRICLDDVLEFICAKENQKENLQRFIAAPIFGKLLSPLVLAFDVSWPQTIQVAATPVAGIPGAPATISKSGKSRELIHAHVSARSTVLIMVDCYVVSCKKHVVVCQPYAVVCS